MTKQSKKQLFRHVCELYVSEFEKKQELDFDYWVADEVGGMADFSSSYFFSLQDIVYDMDTEQPAGRIIDWQHYTVENEVQINYKSYCRGLRPKKEEKKGEYLITLSEEQMHLTALALDDVMRFLSGRTTMDFALML